MTSVCEKLVCYKSECGYGCEKCVGVGEKCEPIVYGGEVIVSVKRV